MRSLVSTMTDYAGDQLTGHVTVPERTAKYGTWGTWVPDSVLGALADIGVRKPWAHQARAADLIHAGQNVVVATGTGSGKSLAAWVPALSAIANARQGITSLATARSRPTVLYLGPTKALGADQEESLTRLATTVDPRIGVATVDGDADGPTRAWARQSADIVLTNPDFAHFGLLGRHEMWQRLWRGLQFVVVDEFHSYRGAFAANVALVVRRLLRVARHYGADPRVVFLSATAYQPAESARRFLGEAFGPVVAVEEDGSPTGQRDIFTMACRAVPDEIAIDDDGANLRRRAANTEAGELTARLVAGDARVLTFVRSRPGTERVAEVSREFLADSAPHLEGTIAAYRGGYLPEERRALESQLRSGDLRGLATTSALELGIDISGLDAVIVTGWPGTRASFQQQIGRAGRAGSGGVGVLIGRENPLDQYILAHPQLLVDGSPEMSVFDPKNPWILPGHLCAAATEVPLTAADTEVFSLESVAPFVELAEADLLKERPTGWYWNPAMKVNPHDLVDIRGGGATNSIIDSESGALLGTVDEGRADYSVHPGAIYLHQGVPYLVESLDEGVALVHRHREEEIRTFARDETSVEILSIEQSVELPWGTWNHGEVVVQSRVVGYDVRRVKDGMFLGNVKLDMPVRTLQTSGVWMTISQAVLDDARISAADIPGTLHAAEHTMIALLPLFATCDRWDIGGLSTALHSQTGMPTIIVHDAMAGGSGCADRGFSAGLDWLTATLDTLAACDCSQGCPRCVQSPKCGNNNEPLDKDGATRLLRHLVGKSTNWA
ncbi:DEAD/DEAH box helicase domain-containing protein [Trueperella bonasi]|uniref:DEAD/DEAH box helicase domain-containing protein n=1 Tax=Trueperella bonasi TaxID=312286 RepID=A0ABT9NHG8_9ACTO|nr:DEAD/DEAH box helicase [Trueperella bonasi]MDP9806238.1 DEAD/DEAH box helicase domain-containing protein [Trueperella bonasi]